MHLLKKLLIKVSFPDSDIIVVIAGTNNIANKTEIVMKYAIKSIIDLKTKRNIIITSIPLRFDNKHLNQQINRINMLIKEQISNHSNNCFEHSKLTTSRLYSVWTSIK